MSGRGGGGGELDDASTIYCCMTSVVALRPLKSYDGVTDVIQQCQ